jgi:hypothetical protein
LGKKIGRTIESLIVQSFKVESKIVELKNTKIIYMGFKDLNSLDSLNKKSSLMGANIGIIPTMQSASCHFYNN